MPTPRNLLGIKGDECQCGRRSSIRHCSSCGSARVYARLNRYHKHLNGEVKQVDNQFRCQACGHLFVDEEREFCEAPPVSQKLAQLKIQRLAEANKNGEFLRPSEEKAAKALEELLQADAKVEAKTMTPVERDKARGLLIYQIRSEYADILYEAKCKNETLSENVDQYIERRISEINATLHENQRIELTPRDEATPQAQQLADAVFVGHVEYLDEAVETQSIAEQSIRKEWAFKKLSGTPSTLSVEEYVKRRLKGELFDDE